MINSGPYPWFNRAFVLTEVGINKFGVEIDFGRDCVSDNEKVED
jgi:hypothetical protein